jgi:2-polyprenyl-3-methyl-5-hydroxy-6-metoxy-1,4-benzoquinol methylase
MNQFYEEYWKGKDAIMPDFKFKWPSIKKYIPLEEKVKILDYGCGKGFILKCVSQLNPSAHTTGVDISQEAINYARKTYKDKQFLTIQADNKLPIKNETYDFILCLDVIEHINDVRLILSEFNRLLKPRGKLLISTPYHGMLKNIITALLFFERVFNPYGAHIRFFSMKSLLQCLHDAGFKPIDKGYCGRIYPVSRCMFVLAEKQ